MTKNSEMDAQSKLHDDVHRACLYFVRCLINC